MLGETTAVVPMTLADFYEREFPRLAGVLTLHTGSREVAVDIAQDAMAAACRHWDRISTFEAPEQWVLRVGINLANSWFRRRAVARRHARQVRSEGVAGPDEIAVVVRAAVAALPARQRTAVVLRYFGDLSVHDTAEVMGCAPGTVKALTSQAIDRLRATASWQFEVDDEVND